MCSHVGGHGLLECGIDVATRLLVLTDTFQPFADMQVGRIVTLTAYIGIEQTALCEIQLGRRRDGIHRALSGNIRIERFVRFDDALVDLFLIDLGCRIRFQGNRIGQFHLCIVPHDHLTARTVAGQRGTVEHRHILIRKLERRLQYIRHRTSVLEIIDTTGRGSRMGNAYIKDLVDRIILMCQQVAAKSGTVIPPAAPAEEAFEAEFVAGIRADITLQVVGCHIVGIFLDPFFRPLELFPVDRFRRSAVDQRIDPGTVGVVAVGTHLDQRYFTDQAFIDDLLGTDITVGLASLVAQLEYDTGFFYYFAHLIGFGHRP